MSAEAHEHHYTPEEVAEMWHIDADSIRRFFRKEEGVFLFGHGSTSVKRAYTTIRIPESVMERVHKQRSVSKPKNV